MRGISQIITWGPRHPAVRQTKPPHPTFQTKYASNIADDVDAAGGSYPLVVQEVYDDGTPIADAVRHIVSSRDDMIALGYRLDGIVPNGRWQVSYSV